MKPFEQFWYKRSWKPGYVVLLHSDLKDRGVSWCKDNIQPHRWDFKEYVESYYHAFYFELEQIALDFCTNWPEYCKRENF